MTWLLPACAADGAHNGVSAMTACSLCAFRHDARIEAIEKTSESLRMQPRKRHRPTQYCASDPHRYSPTGVAAQTGKLAHVPTATGIKRLGLAVAILLVIGVGALLVLSLVIPAQTVRDAVKAEIRAVTGLDPVMRGDISVSLFPRVVVRFNAVSRGDNRTGAPALTTEQLVVRLRFLPFLIGQVAIADVTLVRPSITIAFDSDGSSNWAAHIDTLARALAPSPDRVSSFSEIRIGDGTLVLRDEGFQILETLNHVEFALAWPSISKSFAATGRFVWNDKPIEATLSLSDFVAALTGERSGLKLRLNGGSQFTLAYDGYISHRPALRMERGLAANATSLRDVLRRSEPAMEGSGFQRFAMKAQTNVAGRNIALSKVNLELDGNVGEGVL